MKKNNYRIETDSLGKVKVARNALYGAQTQRAIDNFKMSGITFDPAFIQALSNLKLHVQEQMLAARSYQRIKPLVSHQLLIRSRLIYMILWIIFRLTYFKLALGQAQT